ncbi:hypothetical protein MPH_02691 [Macrophomina phaseolina MS6]|uniref:Enoyl reductase (ER) domain-containing protein n=1 Tax=Macrophomina phaseolina (strain MS6) TaxID=1126212 RepID=K2RBR6_MACPH|nr:hypothetical protein MPH_02691 [Macrophomina phaseolina MS6]
MASLPETYTAAVVDEPNGGLVIKEVPLREPEHGEVLVRVKACGVCHGDAAVTAGTFGKLPIVPGHEFIGDVVALGPGEKKWQVGDRVGGAWHGGHDGICAQCNRGQFQMCGKAVANGVHKDGGYAQYALLRTEATVRVPRDLDPVQAAPLLCAGVTVFNCIRNMHVRPGGTVAIQGLGGLGHLALQYARKLGYRVFALSRDGKKKDFALELGATDYVDGSKESAVEALQRAGGADLVLVTAPSADTIGQLVHACAPGGTVAILAPFADITISTIPLILKGTQGVRCMVEEFPLAKANEAMAHMLNGEVRFRAVINTA